MKDRARIHFLLADDAVIVPIDDETYHQNMQHFNDCIPVILATLKRAGIPDTEKNVRYWISDMAERTNRDICGDGWRQILG